MKVYNAIGTLYNVFGRLKKKELIGSFSTLEQARNAVSQVASKQASKQAISPSMHQ